MPGMMQPQREIAYHADGTATVTVWPLFGGDNASTMRLPFSRLEYDAWQRGDYIQHAMPRLSAEQREFLMSGTTPEQWDKEFGSGD